MSTQPDTTVLIDHLIAKSTNPVGFGGQFTLVNGIMLSGAIRKGPVDGFYTINTMIEKKETRSLDNVDVIVAGAMILLVTVASERNIVAGGPRILAPNQ